jgi:hypothetical protein
MVERAGPFVSHERSLSRAIQGQHVNENRNPTDNGVEITMPDRPILPCVNYTLGSGSHIIGEIGFEIFRFTCLVRPKLPKYS